MLDIFVAPSGMPHADRSRTERLLEKINVPVRIVRVSSLKGINRMGKSNPYYCFFFDCEYPDKGLRKSMKMFLNINMFDYLVLYKKNVRTGHAEFRPRVFRENIQLDTNWMTPLRDFGLKSEDVLNGFIVEHGYESFDKVQVKRLVEMAAGRRVSLLAGR